MCTVTFLPKNNNDFILTSNRDESPLRVTLHPEKYKENSVDLMYPKDVVGGGTWIGVSSKNRLVCVLNGAFVNHQKKDTYRKSRGIIAKDILKEDKLELYLNNLDLNNIEPFTIVIVDWNTSLTLFEIIWDGAKKHISNLPLEAKVWSSSTLYSDSMKTERHQWFGEWEKDNNFSQNKILAFHQSEKGSKENSILMKRPFVETVSITSVNKTDTKIEMLYNDVLHNKTSKVTF